MLPNQAELAAPMPRELIGEIEQRYGAPLVDGYGPNVMLGYLDRPEKSAQTRREGWLRTGDMARSGRDGYLMLVDGVKDRYSRGDGRAALRDGRRTVSRRVDLP
jgi:acyl-CoA synthetase (AMP-forming)/AMP-acid ligase II